MSQPDSFTLDVNEVPDDPEVTPFSYDVQQRQKQEMFDAIITNHQGEDRPQYITDLGSGEWRDDNGRPWYYNGTVDLPQPNLVDAVAPAASATAPGEIGDYAVDGSFRYDCIATNTWVQVAVVGGYA